MTVAVNGMQCYVITYLRPLYSHTDIRTMRTRLYEQHCFTVAEYPIALHWSPDGRWLAVGIATGDIHLIDPSRPRRAIHLAAHADGLLGLAWQPVGPGLLASGGQDGRGRLWRPGIERPHTELAAPARWVEQLAWRADGDALALAGGRRVVCLDAAGHQRWEAAPLPGTVSGLAWRPGGELLAGTHGGIHRLSGDTGSSLAWLAWEGALLNLSLSPDDRVVASSCQDHSVHFWYLANGSDAQMGGYPHKPMALAWHPRTLWLATSGAEAALLWPFEGPGPEGLPPLELHYHGAPLGALAFSQDGDHLATGCRAGEVAVWTLRGGKHILDVVELSGAIAHLAWCRRQDGDWLAIATGTGEVHVLRLGGAGDPQH